MGNRKTVLDVNGVKYALGEKLGSGGQGTVFAVQGTDLAIKIFSNRSQAQRDRLRNQLAHVRRLPLDQLSVARPLEMLRAPHIGYVMELLTGMAPLKTLIYPPKAEMSLPQWYLRTGGLRRRLLVLARAADVLSRLHSKGLVYSDPSPENIFISEDGVGTEVWFIDTDNLCYESAPGLTGGVYTPGYGAPELVRGVSGVNSLTDVHAFSVLAFQVITLAHPFIGDRVHDGEPELEEQAYAGKLPWIEDKQDDSNRASFGVPRGAVLSPRLLENFETAFGNGRYSPKARPGAAAWASRLYAAADATIQCPQCKASFYFTSGNCQWCEATSPAFAISMFQIWDPGCGESGELLSKPHDGKPKPVIVGHGAITEDFPFFITRRLAIGDDATNSGEPVIELSLHKDKLRMHSVDGREYRLCSTAGKDETIVGRDKKELRFESGQAPWQLHFGDNNTLHRVVSFGLRQG